MQHARDVLARIEQPGPYPLDARYRFYARLLRRDLAPWLPVPAEVTHRLWCDPEATMVLLDGAPPLDLTRRPVLSRLLAALVRDQQAGGAGLTMNELVEVGWPDEELAYEAGANRVYASVRLLRKLGLRPVLLSEGGQYRLAPGTWLLVTEPGPPPA